ncbi:MAG: peptidoglycan glycosyltransferase [Cyclobacteriaceae bacterium]|nr:peptidoglycan glycosyltransferase [Cyclobacteriaceae bacterium]
MNKSRGYIIQTVFIGVAILFSIRLFSLQVLDDSYKTAADNNIIQEEIEYPFRGLIYDRNGEILVANKAIFDLLVIPTQLKNFDTIRFCNLVGITVEEFDTKVNKAKAYSYVKASLFIKQISLEDFSKFQDYLDEFSGFVLQPRTTRSYTYPILSNALGYISEISKYELRKDTLNYYHSGDYIGKSGLESNYETYLRGLRGKQFKIRNVRGVEKGKFKDGQFDTLAVPGFSITSTIDRTLQEYAEKLMKGKSGSIVAIEPSTGEILSIVSAPSYDPGMLSGKDFSQNFGVIKQDTLKPLFNRPLMAAYRPGSIFKIVQSLVALQEGVITPYSRFKCNTNLIGCHNGASHPFGTSEKLVGAIKNSCNPFFYQVMRKMVVQNVEDSPYLDAKIGLDKWNKYIKNFGFGAPLGIDLPGEKGGLIPDSKYYDRAYRGREWKYSNIYSLSIGEGENLVVPIQMANFTATVANRGYYYTPHLVKAISNTGKPLPIYTQKKYTGVDSAYFEIAVEAMAEVIKSGTGQYRAKLKDIEVCGKTGTVQNDPNPDHSVFIAFAPRNNPKIAVSVYVENAGQGARAAAAISGLLIEKYLKKDSATLYFEPYVLKGDFE